MDEKELRSLIRQIVREEFGNQTHYMQTGGHGHYIVHGPRDLPAEAVDGLISQETFSSERT